MSVEEVVRRALEEDIGAGDATGEAIVPAGARGVALISQKAEGVLFGLEAAEVAFRTLDSDATVERLATEGEWRAPGPALRIAGSARAILAAERTALNLLGQLSGVATLTARYVREIEGTGVRILDTRKTVPGLRALQKAAVVAGGGVNHRFGLYDAMLVKENHIAMAGGVRAAVERARAAFGDLTLEIECETIAEVVEALDAGATSLLLDNMSPDELRAAVAANDRDPRATLECSGGVTLATVRELAVPGLDFISVGALTHSAPALDVSLLMESVG